MSSVEDLAAFSIWKMFNDTFSALKKTDYNQENVERLAVLIKSKDFSNIFSCERDSSVSYENYRKIADKYETFTTWLLGRFFHLLSIESLNKIHDLVCEVQISILDQISRTQLNVYSRMAAEYSKALCLLREFKQLNVSYTVLEVFVPKKQQDLGEKLDLNPVFIKVNREGFWNVAGRIIKFFKYLLNEAFDFNSFDAVHVRDLDNLLYFLSNGAFNIKLEIISIFLEIMPKVKLPDENVEWEICHNMEIFLAFFENIIYDVYNDKRFALAESDFKTFENLSLLFLTLNTDAKTDDICKFLLLKSLQTGKRKPNSDILKICKKKFNRPLLDLDFKNQNDFQLALKCYNSTVFCGLKGEILENVKSSMENGNYDRCMSVFSPEVSRKWSNMHEILCSDSLEVCSENSCKIENFIDFFSELFLILVEIRIDLKHPSLVTDFFEESTFLCKILSTFNNHFTTCTNSTDFRQIFCLLINFSLIANSSLLTIFADIFSFLIVRKTPVVSSAQCELSPLALKEFKDFLKNLAKYNIDTEILYEFFTRFSSQLACGLFKIKEVAEIQGIYMKIAEKAMTSQQTNIKVMIIKNFVHLLTLFPNVDALVSEILMPALTSSDPQILIEINRILPNIICTSSCPYIKLLQIYKDQLDVEIFCEKCHLNCSNDRQKIIDDFAATFPQPTLAIGFPKIDLDVSYLNGMILTHILKFLTLEEPDLRISALTALPFCSNHILTFHSVNSAKIWIKACGDVDERVRRTFSKVARETIRHGQENSMLSEAVKKNILEILFSEIMKQTKKSLQDSDFKLQETLLRTIGEVSKIKSPETVLPIVKILIYLIMVPTSKHSVIAVDKFFQLAKNHDTSTRLIYKQYKKEICEVVVHLCAVNQAIIDYPLAKSLCKISVTLEFYNSKDFVSKECQSLLPYFVTRLIKMPDVAKLIEEVASLVNSDLSELIKTTYGAIFLHVFLEHSKEDFKTCMAYLEKTSRTKGSILRKKHFWIILNELLLKFSEKRDKVVMALSLLKKEDTESESGDLKDYLQPRMLGILQHFDFKLMAKNSHGKDTVLSSLADLFKFMGSKNITPLRFKIIAMLRTTDYTGFPRFICQVWDSFVRNCEVESLGPQLATIFVSILPLIQTCPNQTNNVFRYLIIENETKIQDYIKDLFFISDKKIDFVVDQTIKKYVKRAEDCSLKDKIKSFLNYLAHETIEVRIGSFKALKVLMEKNREELDKMILGYNGIDPVIVDLIDTLMLGCREKDQNLKLACGDVIGELGAVEPAHLPRRYAQDSQNFTIFMDDDVFIINVLNELVRAFQGEKNTINMDRFAVAIQEILKFYEISPEQNAKRNYLWRQFPEAQQELMLPLLTSKYIITQPSKANFVCPIYNTSVSFNFWLNNWTASLISTLSQENQSVLNVCLPAMKQDQRILMQFLPHIVLYSIIHNSSGNVEKSFIEIKTVASAFMSQPKIDEKLLDVRPFSIPGVKATIDSITPEAVKQAQCTKIVFIILDFLDRWVRELQWQKGTLCKNDANFINVRNFLWRFCKLQLAKCNFHCSEYPRALMYLEDYIAENPNEISTQLPFLAQIYAQLDEPDGVGGVTAVEHNEPTIDQRILALEVSGKLWDAISCYERIPPPMQFHHVQGLMQCYLDLDMLMTAWNFAQGTIDMQPEFGDGLFEKQAMCLWRLGQYEDLDNFLQKPALKDNTSWSVQVGRALLHFEKSDRESFGSVVEALKNQEVDYLGATSLQQGSYQHGYESIAKLHVLNELQQIEKATYELLLKPNDDIHVVNILNHLSKEWELRIKVVQQSLRIVEPLLCLRRVALEQAKRIIKDKVPSALPLLDALLGELWLSSAKTARSAGVHQQAYTYTLRAEEFSPPQLFLEKAELHWLRQEHEQALTILKRGIETIVPDSSKAAVNALTLEKKKLVAQAKLLDAFYNDSISNFDSEVITVNYKDAVDAHKEWEKSFVYLAQYYDRIYQSMKDEEKDGCRGTELQLHMINLFGKSLQYGTTYVYQSLPRLLSIWFDYGTRLYNNPSAAVKHERKNNLLKMTMLVDSFLERLPSYIFLTAFSQLVSRICHPQKEIFAELKSIIIKLLLEYPQQSLWMMISVIKSGFSARAKRCADILMDSRLKTITMSKLIKDFTNLAEKLIELCNKEVPQDKETITVSQLARNLPRMLNKGDFSEIMIPTYNFRKLVLPNPDFSSNEHNPFPNHYVHIVGIDEEVVVLHSLQRPRKITFRGSDGKGYIQMLKPKDDLRKDFRLMEFNDIVNQLLSGEPEARQRRLNIRLYSVAPLNEECGLIEWVPNLVGLRPTLATLYKQRGDVMKAKEIKDASCHMRDPLAKKREVFTTIFLARHPPVLGEWFRRTFPDAQSWIFARTAYIRTLAVMSMVGYILGLGDRHGENILLDSICGDAVHVDFNCLFNKGENFEWPERVPFRLTQNMVAAMGPLGVEGIFRKSCACTLRVLRTNVNILMSIVTPFVYDPLVSWPRNANASASNPAERTNEQAVEHIKNIELRLQGVIKTKSRSLLIPLSVEGQTNHLINEAMSVDNLCQMYIGWGPYL